MRKGLYRESEGQKSGKDGALEPRFSRFWRLPFSISCLLVDAFLLGNLRVHYRLSKLHSPDFQDENLFFRRFGEKTAEIVGKSHFI
jgi:hypothetical protein